jgi:hypothetical protein
MNTHAYFQCTQFEVSVTMPNTVQEAMSKTAKQMKHIAGEYVIPYGRVALQYGWIPCM